MKTMPNRENYLGDAGLNGKKIRFFSETEKIEKKA
jgi:hypothetical protein